MGPVGGVKKPLIGKSVVVLAADTFVKPLKTVKFFCASKSFLKTTTITHPPQRFLVVPLSFRIGIFAMVYRPFIPAAETKLVMFLKLW